jgi:uncharacterized protein with ParB-like and HNH nuclease domain
MDKEILYKIEGEGRTLAEVLSQRYKIDYFQREYKWEKQHMEQLLYDLDFCFFESYKDGDTEEDVISYKPYFLGPYIVYQKGNSCSLIDGQQRLTSLTLILIYLMNIYEETKDELKSLVYQKKFGKESYNLQIADREKVMDCLFKGDALVDRELSISEQNILDRYYELQELFPERLRKEEIIPVFTCWLKEKLMFVEILSYSDENAYTIFETMNDRGLNLTSVEMMKSFILSKVKNVELREKCNDEWIQNIHLLNHVDKETETEFFRAWLRGKYLAYSEKNNDFETIGAGFHRWVKSNYSDFSLKSDKDILNFVSNEMRFYISVFTKIRRAENEFVTPLEIIRTCLPYSIASSLAYPLYLSAISQTDTDSVVDSKIRMIAEYMDCFVVRRILNGQSTGQSSIRGFLYSLIQNVRGCNLKSLERILDEFLQKATYEPKADVPISILQFNFLRYFQYRINLYLAQKLNPNINVYYKSTINIKLVYLEQRNNEVLVLPKNYRTEDAYPLCGIAYRHDIDDTFGNDFLNLVTTPQIVDDYDFPADFATTYKGLTNIQQRAYLVINYLLREIW